MKVEYIFHKNGSVDLAEWKELLAVSTFSTPFQSPGFYDFCNKVDFHRGFVCAVKTNGNGYDAVCVADIVREKGAKSYFSRRAIIYGSPVLRDLEQKGALLFLLKNLHNLLKNKVIYVEIRNLNDYTPFLEVFQQAGWTFIPWLNVRKTLNFKDQGNLLASFRYSRRREILLTLEAGYSYSESEDPQDSLEVYGILKDLYRTRTRLPLPSIDYFQDFIKSGLMKLFVVKDKEGKIAGGSLCIIHDKKTLYTFYYCGKRDINHKAFPTHLAVLAAMEFGIKNGLIYLDFMGAGKPGKEYGVRNYKMGFGGELTETGRFLKVENRILYHLGVQVINAMKRFKLTSILINGIRE